MKWAYYNDNESYVCEWIRNLIKAGLIMDGEVDNRDIRDVRAEDLKPFVRVHMFCGIAGWERALQIAGWPADRPVWTGSCPCGPFSTAGARRGFADERHLWPFWYHLISVCRPPTIFGEQVARSADWQRLVHGDLEAMGYAVGAMPIEAASVGANHLRDRFWFVAVADGEGGHAQPLHAEVAGVSQSVPNTDRDRLRTSEEPQRSNTSVARDDGAQGDVAYYCRLGSCCFNPDECSGQFDQCWLVANPDFAPWRREAWNADGATGRETLCAGEAELGRRGATVANANASRLRAR
jgi:DNA (cytosine-5)-methyltransferase 1